MGNIKTEKSLKVFEDDKFGYKELAQNLNSEVLGNMELPNNFGIYGNWGSGKSTLINFMLEDLKSDKGVHTVYFEAWKYEYSENNDLLYALLNCIKKSLNINNKDWKKFAITLLTVGDSILKQSKLVINSGDVKKSGEMFEELVYNEHEKWSDKIIKFEASFQDIVNKGLKKVGKEKLYIFIDDLDRCLPENTIKLLEAIKNFLFVDNTLFVFAIDKRVVSQMISHQYGMLEDYGEEYLMKIINYEYSLPNIENSDIVTDIFNSFGYGTNFETSQTYITQYLKGIISEPRKVKTILNNFFITLKIKKIEVDEVTIIQFFVAFCIMKTFGNDIEMLNQLRDYNYSPGSGEQRNAIYKTLLENQGARKIEYFKKYIKQEIPMNGIRNLQYIGTNFNTIIEKINEIS